MKKFITACFTVVFACTFTAVVLANTLPVKISRQIILSEEEPTPAPEASTETDSAPEPTPEPYFSPDP